jgi:selenocysteine lyase/cysteine desulfurase
MASLTAAINLLPNRYGRLDELGLFPARPVRTRTVVVEEKAGVLSFVIDGIPTESLGKALDREGIAVRAGHHCAMPTIRHFGLESSVRPSLAFYNTTDEIDTLVASLHDLVGRHRP